MGACLSCSGKKRKSSCHSKVKCKETTPSQKQSSDVKEEENQKNLTPTTQGQSTSRDAELKKAEKARRKAEYEVTGAEQIAAEEAERDKLKNEKSEGSQSQLPTPETFGNVNKKPTIVTTTTTSAAAPKTSTVKKPIQSGVQTLFDHFPKGVDPIKLFEEPGMVTEGLDSAFITLGLMYSHGQVSGSNNRVIALIEVVRTFIGSYTTPADEDFVYEFPLSLKNNLEFLRKCRPFAVAMNNTVEFINSKLRGMEIGKAESEIKTDLSETLQQFRDERVDKAKDAVVAKAKTKIANSDVVLIFGSSDLVGEVILEASKQTSFSLIVVDPRPYAAERKCRGLERAARSQNAKVWTFLFPKTK